MNDNDYPEYDNKKFRKDFMDLFSQKVKSIGFDYYGYNAQDGYLFRSSDCLISVYFNMMKKIAHIYLKNMYELKFHYQTEISYEYLRYSDAVVIGICKDLKNKVEEFRDRKDLIEQIKSDRNFYHNIKMGLKILERERISFEPKSSKIQRRMIRIEDEND